MPTLPKTNRKRPKNAFLKIWLWPCLAYLWNVHLVSSNFQLTWFLFVAVCFLGGYQVNARTTQRKSSTLLQPFEWLKVQTLQVRTKTIGFFSVFLDSNLSDSKNLKVLTNGFLQAEKNMGHFCLPLKISGRIVGLCIKGSLKKKHPGSPKTKLCPLVAGNPLHGSSQRLFFVWSWTSREQPTKTPTEKIPSSAAAWTPAPFGTRKWVKSKLKLKMWR